jgi:NADH-quinone oxidoreductase subunit G
MPKVTVNGLELEVPAGTNLIQAAEMADQEIPHYCYHPGLSIAGNCRMCLIEIKALSDKQNTPLPKLQIACNTFVQDGMVIESDNPRVREARRSVLEFLLINHPIDCPICDQAGECKLQEYYMDYGRYESRFPLADKVEKHKVVPVGPSIMLDQERCILCTRCVRFLDEVTETHELTITERGDHSELTLATGASVDNDYAANIVDICPVGALTNRDFRFQARVWYLDSADSVCAGCSTGCNIEVNSRRGQMYRLKPRANTDVNGFWMCDHGRRTHESNEGADRLQASLVREGGRFVDLDYGAAARRAASGLRTAGSVGILASASTTLEEGFLAVKIQELVGEGPRIQTSPATSDIASDDRLISTDRFPNRRGLAALGYAEATDFDQPINALLVLRADPVGDDASWAERLEDLHAAVVVSDRVGETTGFADQVLAVGSHFECDGSFVNRGGRVQKFQAAVPPPGQAVAGWEALAALLAALGGPVYDSQSAVLDSLLADLRDEPLISADAAES